VNPSTSHVTARRSRHYIRDEPLLVYSFTSEALASEVGDDTLPQPMFRKPRELPALIASETPIRHSTGRPPTPPPSTNLQSSPRTNASTTYNMATTTPLVGKTKLIQKRTPSTANGSAARARGKANSNGNIMSFFKKAESSGTNGTLSKDDEGSLFFDEDSFTIEGLAPIQTPTPPREEGSFGDVEMMREDSPISRYNEATAPVKRRRFEEPADQPPVPKAAHPPKARKTGPFADDSDSGDEDPRPLDIMKPVLEQPIGYDEVKMSKPASAPANDLPTLEQEFPPLPLKHEATSMSRDTDFEGMGDFIDDEFPEDGEEFMERRWMEEQGELEMGLEDEDEYLGAVTTPKEEPRDSPSFVPQDTGSACCPICSGSTAGMAEQVSQEYQQKRSRLTAYSKYLRTSTTA